MSVLHLNEQNFDATINEGTSVVDFWAEWCGPCQALLPTIDELGSELQGKAAVGKVNVDEGKELARQFRVMSVPTVIFFQDGVEKARLVGAYPKQKYLDTLETL